MDFETSRRITTDRELRYADFSARSGLEMLHNDECFLKVAAKPCPLDGLKTGEEGWSCEWCLDQDLYPKDHTSIWKQPNGEVVLGITQPYPYMTTKKRMTDFQIFCNRHGLLFQMFEGLGFWNPDRVNAIIVAKIAFQSDGGLGYIQHISEIMMDMKANGWGQ